jgi:hypothetical protein
MRLPPLAELAPPVVGSPAESPPSLAHLAQIEDARRRVRPIRRAASIARFNGWTLVGFAGVTLLCSVGSFWGIVVGLALTAVGYFELRGGKELRRLDRTSPVRLAWNQLALGLLLIAYASVNIYAARYGPSVVADPQLSGGDAQLTQMLAPYDSLARSITSAVYAVVGLVGAAVPALTAMFYLRRRRMIDDYLAHTPAWIVNLQRMGSTL